MILKKFRLNLNYNIIFSCHIVDDRCYTINKVTVYYVVYKSIVENLLNIVNKYYAVYIIIALITHLVYIIEGNETGIILTTAHIIIIMIIFNLKCIHAVKRMNKASTNFNLNLFESGSTLILNLLIVIEVCLNLLMALKLMVKKQINVESVDETIVNKILGTINSEVKNN
jgi:hypothetical protein